MAASARSPTSVRPQDGPSLIVSRTLPDISFVSSAKARIAHAATCSTTSWSFPDALMFPVLESKAIQGGRRCLFVNAPSIEYDDSFGPTLRICPPTFDFTLLFEQSILSIGPSALLLLFLPFRLWWIWGRGVKARYSSIVVIKQVGLVHLSASSFLNC